MRFQHLSAWLEWQQALHPEPIALGLERVGEIYRRLGSPRPATVLTVAGTNGKGSVVATLQAILGQAGYDVGALYSPHLLRYAERIQVHGREAGEQMLLDAFGRIDSVRDDITLTYFEWNALAALVAFAMERVDVAVLEVGMGGRLDAVNVVDADVAVITSIGLDHMDWLGPTLEDIAREKSGILRPGRAAVYGSRRMPHAIAQVAADLGVRLRRLGVDFDFVERPDGWNYVGLGSKRLELPLPVLAGAAQLDNAAAALAALEAAEPRLLIPDGAVRQGLARVQLPGRFQRIGADPEWILDVAHNPDAARLLAANLAADPARGRTLAVCGILGDKDVEGIAAQLRDRVDQWLAAGLAGPRGLPAEALAGRLGEALACEVEACADVEAACERARQLAGPGDRIVVFGSFHTVGPALALLRG